MSEEWKVQLSFKNTKGDLLNVRGAHAKEVQQIIEEATGLPSYESFFASTFVVVPAPSDAVDTDVVQAQELVTKHLGADQVEPATKAQVMLLVSKGVPVGEARTLSKTDASARITALKGSK